MDIVWMLKLETNETVLSTIYKVSLFPNKLEQPSLLRLFNIRVEGTKSLPTVPFQADDTDISRKRRKQQRWNVSTRPARTWQQCYDSALLVPTASLVPWPRFSCLYAADALLLLLSVPHHATTRFYPSSYRVQSSPCPVNPLHSVPLSAYRSILLPSPPPSRPDSLGVLTTRLSPLQKRARADSYTASCHQRDERAKSPLEEKHLSSPCALSAFSVILYLCLCLSLSFPYLRLCTPCLPFRPACRHNHFSPLTPGLFVSLRSMARSFLLPFFRIFLSRFFCHFASVYPLPG